MSKTNFSNSSLGSKEMRVSNHITYENSTSSSYPNFAKIHKKKYISMYQFFNHPLLIAVSTEIGLKGLRALFTYHVIGTFFMQE